MSEMTVDVLVIGFGKAGKTIAMKRASAGDTVAIVEASPQMYGGTCINIGCVPTKRLLTDAHRGLDYLEATQQRDDFISKLNAANKAMQTSRGVLIVDGTARFTAAHTVQVTGGDDQLSITADTIIINTGAVAVRPDLPGIHSSRVVDSTQIQHLDARPERLVVVGGGPIGLEFATMFAGFGSQVTVLDGAPRFLSRSDEDIAAAVAEELGAQGIQIQEQVRVTGFREGNDSIVVEYDGGSIDADLVLLAIGRRPNTDDLDLSSGGIVTTDTGAVQVDEHLRTNVEGVYAAGDVTGGPQFTYISFDDHRVIMDDRWGTGERVTTGRIFPTTTFLEPPLSQVGLSEEQAREKAAAEGFELAVKAANVADLAIVPRPKILRTPQGRVKFLVDASHDRILGATLWCIDSQELINTVALAITEGIPASHLGDGIWTHPSSSEIFNALLG